MPILSTLIGLLNGTTSGFFNNYVAALIILLVGVILGNLVGQLMRKLLNSFGINKLIRRTGLGISLEEILSGVFRYIVYLVTIVLAMNQVGMTRTLVEGVCLAVALILIISICIALKDFVPNLIAGLYLLHGNTVKVGDSVEFDNTKGKVIAIHIMDSRLETGKKEFLVVPNSTMLKKLIKVKKSS